MNCIDLGRIDRLVRRNSNLLTAFKVIDRVETDLVIENIRANIRQLNASQVAFHGNVLDIIGPDGTIAISYYFADSYSGGDVELILAEIESLCESLDVKFQVR